VWILAGSRPGEGALGMEDKTRRRGLGRLNVGERPALRVSVRVGLRTPALPERNIELGFTKGDRGMSRANDVLAPRFVWNPLAVLIKEARSKARNSWVVCLSFPQGR
jgi:hypothetical protein